MFTQSRDIYYYLFKQPEELFCSTIGGLFIHSGSNDFRYDPLKLVW